MAVELKTDQARGWLDAVKDFDKTSKAVNDNAAALIKLASQSRTWPAAMQAQYRKQLENGLAAQQKLSDLLATRTQVVGWLQKLLPGGLGAVPVAVFVGVSLAVFVAAIASAKIFLSGAADFAKQYSAYREEQQRLIDQGMSPAEAAKVASRTTADLAKSSDAPGMLERLGGKAIAITGVVVLAIFLGPQVLKYFTRARAR